jgi:hypothetical protein
MRDVSRRGFLGSLLVGPLAGQLPAAWFLGGHGAVAAAQPQPASALPAAFPQQDPAIAREMVGVSHGNLARVKELVSARPALARAAWDWGYGDWETALGAAAHVGNREIAAVLLAAGAPPTIFSAAMLGQLEAVRAFVTASPGIQRIQGPHGFSVLHHARAGKSDEVVKYLEGLGDADTKYPSEPLPAGDPDGLIGTYTFGPSPTDRLIVGTNPRGALTVARDGQPERFVSHHGNRVFNPPGAEAVRLRFEPASGRATTLVVVDGPLQVRASRV